MILDLRNRTEPGAQLRRALRRGIGARIPTEPDPSGPVHVGSVLLFSWVDLLFYKTQNQNRVTLWFWFQPEPGPVLVQSVRFH